MTQLYITQTFQKKFRRVPKNIQSRVEKALEVISRDPFAGKKLMGDLEGEYSYRIGGYKMIYVMDGKGNIWIETVSHRKDVYRKK
jgi:mRNA-degrading endonuclease RelE of RelBE toxin-antitoxin system